MEGMVALSKWVLINFILCLAVNITLIAIVEMDTVRNVNFGVGILFIMLGAIVSGFLVSGDRIRANYHSSTPEDREQQRKWTGLLFLLGLPYMIIAIVMYMIGSSYTHS
ncbi:DUF5316 domain-containing protein [Cohnella sp. CFH 77786]|uniref:DUF5316 domain-containing protein n=1 Tax=Cohnella sp. CFH 77786 TaxID=2662265 RepID=UPI001C60E47B